MNHWKVCFTECFYICDKWIFDIAILGLQNFFFKMKHVCNPYRKHYSFMHNLMFLFHPLFAEAVFWPVFIIATLATVVGSQAIISATYSIISQCRALRCFPRVKIIHTSNQVHGQIYIPEVNWILMVLCIIVTVGFRDTAMIGNAYGTCFSTISWNEFFLWVW